MPVTLINPFEVPAGKEAEAVAFWEKVAAFMKQQPGFISTRALGFGWHGGGILLTSPLQSPKLIAVWTELDSLPLVVANPAPIILGLLLFGLGHACIYHWLSSSWPPGVIPRTLRLAGLTFFLSFLFWEFFTPCNQFGEPCPSSPWN
jgi:hypothetical protein